LLPAGAPTATFNTATFTTANNMASQLVISTGVRANVNGSFASSGAVQVDGTLGGTGSVGTTTVSATGTLSPGTSPGILSVGNMVLNSGSVFVAELNGSTAGSGYDQVNVTGTVNLGGATFSGSLGYVPVLNSVLTIVNNDGSDSITGTFNGISEGDTVTIGAYKFQMSYKGGTGNDVTLKSVDGTTASPPTATITLDNGTAQRSVIRSILVTFSENVNYPSGASAAFQLARLVSSASPGPTGNAPITVAAGSNTATITFPDSTFAPQASVGAATQGGSIIDGKYQLTIFASKVTGVGGQLNGGTDNTTNFFRLFGDSNGDSQVTLVPDFNNFRAGFNPVNNTIFDYNGDGLVTTVPDFNQFRAHFFPFAP
jgi:hypothetical protein